MARTKRHATGAVRADQHAVDLARRLGSALREARLRTGLKQADAARRAGLSQSTWSSLEIDGDARYTLGTWDRAAHAVGTSLSAHLPASTAAGMPRDAVHLRNQELVLRTALPGRWAGVPEQELDPDPMRSRHGDVVLRRQRTSDVAGDEWCLVEVVDWIEDVGESVRDFDRRLGALDRRAIARMIGDQAVPATAGLWLLRATTRNRRLVGEHRHFFRGRFPGSSRAWLAALVNPDLPMPAQPGLLWVDVPGTRIVAARLGV